MVGAFARYTLTLHLLLRNLAAFFQVTLVNRFLEGLAQPRSFRHISENRRRPAALLWKRPVIRCPQISAGRLLSGAAGLACGGGGLMSDFEKLFVRCFGCCGHVFWVLVVVVDNTVHRGVCDWYFQVFIVDTDYFDSWFINDKTLELFDLIMNDHSQDINRFHNDLHISVESLNYLRFDS